MNKEKEIEYFRKYVIKQYIDDVFGKTKLDPPKNIKVIKNGKLKYRRRNTTTSNGVAKNES